MTISPLEPEEKKAEPKQSSYLDRNYPMMVIFIIGLIVAISPGPFQIVGTLAYIIVLPSGAMLMTTAIRRFFHRDTSDNDARTGLFIKEWNALPPDLRITLTIVQLIGYFIGICIIVSQLIS